MKDDLYFQNINVIIKWVIKKMKTVKQLADELGVSKTAIRKRMDSDFRANYVQTTENNVLIISEIGCEIIAKTLKTSENQIPQTTENIVSDNSMILFLQEQLREKDKQIEALTKALENTTSSLKASQALHAGTIQNQLTESSESEPKKKRWWRR